MRSLATRGTTRGINRRIALDLIRTRQPVSRPDLARLMGTRRGAVTPLVNELINAIDPSHVYIGGEITAAWDLIDGTVRAGLSERALTAAASATPIVIAPPEQYPRLRGAAALVAARSFAGEGAAGSGGKQ